MYWFMFYHELASVVALGFNFIDLSIERTLLPWNKIEIAVEFSGKELNTAPDKYL